MNNKLKVLQINKFHYLKGGSERYYFGVSELLQKNGHEVIYFSMQSKENKPSKYEKYFVDYVDLHKFSLKNIIKFFYNYDAIRRLKKLIKKEKPDIAHLHNIAHQLTPAIINLLKKNNIKVVQTLHDYKLICPNAEMYNKNGNCKKCLRGKYYHCFLNSCLHNSRAKSFLGMLEAYFYRYINKAYDKVDVFIAPSQFMKNAVVKAGISESKVKVLYNFLSDKWLSEANKMSLNGEEKKDDYLLYFGRLSKEKGVETVLESLVNLKTKKIKFLIVGSGPEKNNIKKKIEELGLGGQASLLGFKSGKELYDLIQNAKAIIVPSLWPENMPYSVLESLALGKIVIASRVGGLPELIDNEKNGYLYKVGDRQELSEKIEKLYNLEPKKYLRMSKESQEKSLLFQAKSHYDVLNSIYNGRE